MEQIILLRMQAKDNYEYDNTVEPFPSAFLNIYTGERHANHVNWYYTKSFTHHTYPLAIYCIEPGVSYIHDGGYYELGEFPKGEQIKDLTSKQQELLAYVLYNGQVKLPWARP